MNTRVWDLTATPRRLFALLVLSTLLAACGGGGGDGDGGGTPVTLNIVPNAVAGLDAVVRESESISFDGSGSIDPDGTIAAYAWSASGDAVITLEGADTATPSFTAPDVGADTDIELTLEVTDNKGKKNTDTLTVTIFHHVDGNAPPTPIAGPVGDATPGAMIMLDASASTDTDGAVAAYKWVQLSGDPVELLVDGPIASFQAPSDITSEIVFLFRLFVTDSAGERNAIDVPVTVKPTGDQPPVANAGPPQSVNAGESVTLNGGGTDNETATEALQLAWTQASGTPAMALDNTGIPAPTFTTPADLAEEVVFTFELTVTDSTQQTATASTTVTVKPLIAGNVLPVAIIDGPEGAVAENVEVVLDGGNSTDEDGSIVKYEWVQLDVTPETHVELQLLNDGKTVEFTTPRITAPTALRFRLTVTDDQGAVRSAIAGVEITDANLSPQAVINNGVDAISVQNGALVDLDGIASIDDGTIESYSWSADNEAIKITVNTLNSTLASFTAPAVAGDYTITLTVTDDGGLTSTDTITVTVRENLPPVVNAGEDKTVNAGDPVTLNGSGNDPEGRNLKEVRWTHLPNAGQTTITLEKNNTFEPTFTAPQVTATEETFTFELRVTDDLDQIVTDTVNVKVRKPVAGNTRPVAVVVPTVNGSENAIITLDGRESHDNDPGDSIAGYAWTQTGLVAGEMPVVLDLDDPARPRFDAGRIPAAGKTLTFELVVADTHGDVSLPAVVTVNIFDTGPDLKPDDMVFEAVSNAELHVPTFSNMQTVTGIEAPIEAHLFAFGGHALHPTATFRVTSASGGPAVYFQHGVVNPGDRVQVGVTLTEFAESTTTYVVFGKNSSPVYESPWSVTAKLSGDQAPQFSVADITDLSPDEVRVSAVITPVPDSFNTATPISAEADDGFTVQILGETGDSPITILRTGEKFRVRVAAPGGDSFDRNAIAKVIAGGEETPFTVRVRSVDTTPEFDPASIPAQEGLEPEAAVTTDIKVIGFDGELAASVSGESAQMQLSEDNGITFGPRVSAMAVTSGDVVRFHGVSAPFDPDGASVTRTMTLRVGGETRDFVVTTRAPNRIPDDTFSIAEKTNAAVGLPVRSDVFTIPGIDVPVPVSVTSSDPALAAVLLKNGTQIVNGDTAGPTDELVVELMTPEAVNAEVSAAVTAGIAEVGQKTAVFNVTTASVDTTPGDVTFNPAAGALRGEFVESNFVTIEDMTSDTTTNVSVSGDAGAAYAIQRAGEASFGSFTIEAGTIANGDRIKVGVNAAATFNDVTRVMLDVGGRLEEFLVTSEVDDDPPQVEITFPVNGALFNAEVSAGGINTLTVFAIVDDNDAVTGVRINDQGATFDSIVGQWKAQIPVIVGDNPITVTAVDAAGNEGIDDAVIHGETGMFGDMEKMRWAGDKLYTVAGAGAASRLLEVNPATGERRTIKLTGVNGVSEFVPDDVGNPTRFYILSNVNDIIYEFDIATGTGTLVSPPTQTPDISPFSPLQVVTNTNGTHLLAAVNNSSDGVQLIQVLPGGTRRIVATLAGYGFVNGFSVVGTTGWLFARDAYAGSSGVIVKIDLSDLNADEGSLPNVVMTDQRPVSAEVLAPIAFSESTQLQVDVTDGDGDPLLFVLGSQTIVALQSNGSSSTLVTASDHGAGPNLNRFASKGLTMSPSGDLYVVDDEWSAILRVDRATGDRIMISGLHGNQIPADSVRPFTGAGQGDVLGMATLPDGRLIAERTSVSQTTGITREVATYDTVSGSWRFLFDGQLDVADFGGAFEFLPVSDTEFLVGHDRWRTPTSREGFGRISQDAATGEWRQELFSVAADGKAMGEDWNFLRAAARDPANGDIWVLSSFADDFKLFQVDAATGNRIMALDLPASIDGFTPRGLLQSVHRLAFAEDGRIFWLADSTTPPEERVFLIDREAQSVSLYSDVDFLTAPDDLVIDESLQLAYLAGDFATRVGDMDVLPGSPREGLGGVMSNIPFPSLNVGPNTSDHANLVFDSERRRLWIYQPRMRTMYLLQPDTGEAVMLPKH